MKIVILPIICIFLAGCNIAPKGEYSRRRIDRPYSLPDDVARSFIGGTTGKLTLDDPDDSLTGEEEESSLGGGAAVFEWGIGKNANWIFPFGAKYKIYEDGDHIFGVTGLSFFIFNMIQFDYWYRINSDFSLRPYVTSYRFDFIFLEEERDYLGTELVYQANDAWSIGTFAHLGSYKASSDLIEAILTGVTGADEDDFTVEAKGSYYTIGFNTLYSINENWDFEIKAYFEKYDMDGGYTLTGYQGQAGFAYIW